MSSHVQSVYNKYLNRQGITARDQQLAKNEVNLFTTQKPHNQLQLTFSSSSSSHLFASTQDEEKKAVTSSSLSSSSIQSGSAPRIDFEVIDRIVDPTPEAQLLEVTCLVAHL